MKKIMLFESNSCSETWIWNIIFSEEIWDSSKFFRPGWTGNVKITGGYIQLKPMWVLHNESLKIYVKGVKEIGSYFL